MACKKFFWIRAVQASGTGGKGVSRNLCKQVGVIDAPYFCIDPPECISGTEIRQNHGTMTASGKAAIKAKLSVYIVFYEIKGDVAPCREIVNPIAFKFFPESLARHYRIVEKQIMFQYRVMMRSI